MPKKLNPNVTPLPQVRKVLRREMTNFFTKLQTPVPATTGVPAWPGVPDQEFLDALADALLDAGRRRNMGIAHLQTLVIELQDRINDELGH